MSASEFVQLLEKTDFFSGLANARAVGPTRVLDFDGKAVLARCEADTDFGYALLRRFSGMMGTRLEAAQRKMMDQWAPAGLP